MLCITAMLPSRSMNPGSYPFWLIKEEISSHCAQSSSLGKKEKKTKQSNKQNTKPPNYWNIVVIEDAKIGADYTLKWYIGAIRRFLNNFLLHQDYLGKVSQSWGKTDGCLDLILQRSQKMTKYTSGPEMKLRCIFRFSNRHSINLLT